MKFTDSYFDIGGTVYYYDKVNSLPHEKENALVLYLAMTCKSWTFNRMTAREKENCINTFLYSSKQGFIKGNYETRWNIMHAIYSAFLAALDYDSDPANWRG